jgi:hypothetical protein
MELGPADHDHAMSAGEGRVRLDEFVASLGETIDVVDFFAPSMHLESIGNAWTSESLRWAGEIDMSHLESRLGDPEIAVGQVDFLMVHTGVDGLLADLAELKEFSALRTDKFTSLFVGRHVAPDVVEHFVGLPVEAVMVVLNVVVHEPFRGHHLGAWALSQVVDTMLPASTALVAMFPHWDAEVDNEVSIDKLEAINRFNAYWRRAGLEPLPGHPEILAQHTGRDAFSDALAVLRERFHGDDDYVIEVPSDTLRRYVGAAGRKAQG